jgi:hypothetical protein
MVTNCNTSSGSGSETKVHRQAASNRASIAHVQRVAQSRGMLVEQPK